MAWTWRFEPNGHSAQPAPTFTSQADAESWLGMTYPDLLDAGVDEVTLLEGERVEYGPMSLHPA